MKTSVKLFLIGIFVAGFSQVSKAQQPQQLQNDPPGVEERVNRAIKIIANKIEISESEKESIRNAFTDFYEKVDKVLKSGERPERLIMEGYERERDSKIKLVLSEEKYEDYLRMTCQLRPQPNRNNRRHPDAGKPIN